MCVVEARNREVRPGFNEIRAKAFVKAPGATEQELKELCTYVQDTSPAKDMLANPVPVSTTVEVLWLGAGATESGGTGG